MILPPPQQLDFRCDSYDDFVLSVNRLDRAKRIDLLLEAAAADGSIRVRHRRRRAGPRAARAARGRARARTGGRPSRVACPRAELADLYARCRGVYYAPVDEDYGMVPYEAFMAEKPVVTTRDAGGPLDIVHDRRDGPRDRAARRRARARVPLPARARGRGARVGQGRAARSPSGVTWDHVVAAEPAAREGRVLLPDAAGALRHRRLLGAPAAGAARARSTSTSRVAASRARGDVALYHVGNDPDAHGWIVDALRREPGVVVLHDFVLHHLVAGMTLGRKDGPGYLAAMERDGGVAGRLLGLGVIDGCIPPLWEVRPEDFPLCGEVLDRATGVIVHSRYVEERVRERGYDGAALADPAPRVACAGRRRRERVDGAPVLGAFGNLNASKRVPQLLDAFARFRESHPDARLLLVGAAAPGRRPLRPDRARRARRRRSCARTTSTSAGSGR